MPGTHRRTTTQRGLGYRHKKQVEHLKSVHIDGTPCWWCGEPMFLSQPLSGDHSVPRAIAGPNALADRLLHGPCNSDRGDGSRDDQRPALTGKRRAAGGVDLGRRVMAWPA